MPDRRVHIADLVSNFRAHIKAYKSKDFKESEVRAQFIDKLWQALGWDVTNTQSASPTDAEVIIEKNIETVDAGGLRSRRPDYIFRLGGFPRFIVPYFRYVRGLVYRRWRGAWLGRIHKGDHNPLAEARERGLNVFGSCVVLRIEHSSHDCFAHSKASCEFRILEPLIAHG